MIQKADGNGQIIELDLGMEISAKLPAQAVVEAWKEAGRLRDFRELFAVRIGGLLRVIPDPQDLKNKTKWLQGNGHKVFVLDFNGRKHDIKGQARGEFVEECKRLGLSLPIPAEARDIFWQTHDKKENVTPLFPFPMDSYLERRMLSVREELQWYLKNVIAAAEEEEKVALPVNGSSTPIISEPKVINPAESEKEIIPVVVKPLEPYVKNDEAPPPPPREESAEMKALKVKRQTLRDQLNPISKETARLKHIYAPEKEISPKMREQSRLLREIRETNEQIDAQEKALKPQEVSKAPTNQTPISPVSTDSVAFVTAEIPFVPTLPAPAESPSKAEEPPTPPPIEPASAAPIETPLKAEETAFEKEITSLRSQQILDETELRLLRELLEAIPEQTLQYGQEMAEKETHIETLKKTLKDLSKNSKRAFDVEIEEARTRVNELRGLIAKNDRETRRMPKRISQLEEIIRTRAEKTEQLEQQWLEESKSSEIDSEPAADPFPAAVTPTVEDNEEEPGEVVVGKVDDEEELDEIEADGNEEERAEGEETEDEEKGEEVREQVQNEKPDSVSTSDETSLPTQAKPPSLISENIEAMVIALVGERAKRIIAEAELGAGKIIQAAHMEAHDIVANARQQSDQLIHQASEQLRMALGILSQPSHAQFSRHPTTKQE